MRFNYERNEKLLCSRLKKLSSFSFTDKGPLIYRREGFLARGVISLRQSGTRKYIIWHTVGKPDKFRLAWGTFFSPAAILEKVLVPNSTFLVSKNILLQF